MPALAVLTIYHSDHEWNLPDSLCLNSYVHMHEVVLLLTFAQVTSLLLHPLALILIPQNLVFFQDTTTMPPTNKSTIY